MLQGDLLDILGIGTLQKENKMKVRKQNQKNQRTTYNEVRLLEDEWIS